MSPTDVLVRRGREEGAVGAVGDVTTRMAEATFSQAQTAVAVTATTLVGEMLPSSRRARGPGRLLRSGRLVLVLAIFVVLLALMSARGVAGFYTDYLWFDSLRFTSVWSGVLFAKVSLVLALTAVLVALLWANLAIAQRLAPAVRPAGPEEEALAPVHAVWERRPAVFRVAIALFLAVPLGLSGAGRWNDWILFRNRVDFGTRDPLFERDLGFYVFQLPFVSFVTNWAFIALVVVTIVTAAAHYLNGGIRVQVRPPRVTPAVKAHLSVLLGMVALVKALNYYLDRFQLAFSTRGAVEGATYTDVNAQVPALNLLIFISVLAALLFLYNIRRQGWLLPITAVGLWVLVAVAAGYLYPAAVQRFRVEPAESTKEARYIERNIEATRAAMGLDDVNVRDFAYNEELSADALGRNAETVRNIRLWDPQVLQRTYQRLQEVRTFYRFTDVDVDRYPVAAEVTQILLSARELNPESLPSDTWENRHLAFTHGYGAVLSPANSVTADGQPDFLVKNIPPQGEPAVTQPRLYHGEAIGGYGIVNTGRDEIDYLREDGTAVTNRYDGTGGVGIGSIVRRAAFALRFGDVNPIISGFMTGDSRILYIRDVGERVRKIAPFLHYDHDPYPVVVDGRITWIIDAYTTTNSYPYGQQADTNRVNPRSGLHHPFNYVRNSVKVAVDAYDGNATFYVVDPTDPIAAAYAKAFPKLFSTADEVPDQLRAHFRYPEDLFRVQTNMWGRYHIGDPNEFYSQSDRWNIAQDPGSAGGTAPATGPGTSPPAASGERRMDPYYLLTRLPGEPRGEFLILQPFVPFSADDSRRELSAFMVAKSDPAEYGKLEVFVMPRDRQVDGPAIVNARINQEPEVSQLITLLSRAGSEVLLGNLVIIPVEQSLVYIRPLYVQATGANAVPELKKVIVAFGDRIAVRDTLQDALVAVFGDAPETREEGPSTGPVPPTDAPGGLALPEEARRLFDAAARAFAEADAALRNGDPVAYAGKVQEGRQAFDRAREAAAGATAVPTTLTPGSA
ncbi:MAG TPA: UPF0182 family protein [Acidimicrobiales bacterium]|nr:UPF0182 family protein [Acidimicrobiales bacterium]